MRFARRAHGRRSYAFRAQEDYIKEEQRNLKRELLRAQEEVKRIQAVPLVIGQFMEAVDGTSGIVGSTTGSNYYVRTLQPAVVLRRADVRIQCTSWQTVADHCKPDSRALCTAHQLRVEAPHGTPTEEWYPTRLPMTGRGTDFLFASLREPSKDPVEPSGCLSRDRPSAQVRILSTLNRELLKPSASVALHRHSNALVDILPPEADSSISLLDQSERPDVSYSVRTCCIIGYASLLLGSADGASSTQAAARSHCCPTPLRPQTRKGLPLLSWWSLCAFEPRSVHVLTGIFSGASRSR